MQTGPRRVCSHNIGHLECFLSSDRRTLYTQAWLPRWWSCGLWKHTSVQVPKAGTADGRGQPALSPHPGRGEQTFRYGQFPRILCPGNSSRRPEFALRQQDKHSGNFETLVSRGWHWQRVQPLLGHVIAKFLIPSGEICLEHATDLSAQIQKSVEYWHPVRRQ